MSGKYLRKKPKKKNMGAFFLLLAAAFAVVIAVSIWKITENKNERAAGVQAYASLAQTVVTQQPAAPAEVETTVVVKENEQTPAVDISRPLTVDFEALQAINPQVKGWISSDTGAINYPVVLGTDNDYYLTHLVDGTYNSNGSIFMDFRNAADLSDRNTFIYGHNMRNGAMFASLSLYSTPGYPEDHPELLLVTPDGSYSLQVFAGCVVPGNSDLYQISYRDQEEFVSYVEKVRTMSDFYTDVSVEATDRIVTLSTCAYNYDDARYLLFCKLVTMR